MYEKLLIKMMKAKHFLYIPLTPSFLYNVLAQSIYPLYLYSLANVSCINCTLIVSAGANSTRPSNNPVANALIAVLLIDLSYNFYCYLLIIIIKSHKYYLE